MPENSLPPEHTPRPKKTLKVVVDPTVLVWCLAESQAFGQAAARAIPPGSRSPMLQKYVQDFIDRLAGPVDRLVIFQARNLEHLCAEGESCSTRSLHYHEASEGPPLDARSLEALDRCAFDWDELLKSLDRDLSAFMAFTNLTYNLALNWEAVSGPNLPPGTLVQRAAVRDEILSQILPPGLSVTEQSRRLALDLIVLAAQLRSVLESMAF
jgi:hypothetical protein